MADISKKQELPKGSTIPNWPILAGGAISILALVSLILTSEPEPESSTSR